MKITIASSTIDKVLEEVRPYLPKSAALQFEAVNLVDEAIDITFNMVNINVGSHDYGHTTWIEINDKIILAYVKFYVKLYKLLKPIYVATIALCENLRDDSHSLAELIFEENDE